MGVSVSNESNNPTIEGLEKLSEVEFREWLVKVVNGKYDALASPLRTVPSRPMSALYGRPNISKFYPLRRRLQVEAEAMFNTVFQDYQHGQSKEHDASVFVDTLRFAWEYAADSFAQDMLSRLTGCIAERIAADDFVPDEQCLESCVLLERIPCPDNWSAERKAEVFSRFFDEFGVRALHIVESSINKESNRNQIVGTLLKSEVVDEFRASVESLREEPREQPHTAGIF